jgi:hypothetical protein
MTPRVTAPQPTASATEKLIAVLEATRAKLMTHAQPEHRFRFVSAAQSRPYAMAYALWIKNGEVGTQPMARPRKCAPPSMTKGNPLRNSGFPESCGRHPACVETPMTEFRGMTGEGLLRHPSYKGGAPDVGPAPEVAGSSRCKGGCGWELCCAEEIVEGAIVAAQHRAAAVNSPA